MKSDLFSENLVRLEKTHPRLAQKVRSFQPTGKYSAPASQAGSSFLVRNFPDGTKRTLLSSYDPVQEAVRFVGAQSAAPSLNFLVLGFGLGYHVLELARRIPDASQVVVIESDLEVFYLALANIDLSSVMDRPGMHFHVGADIYPLAEALEESRTSFALNGYKVVGFKALMDLDRKYYENMLAGIVSVLFETEVDLKTKAAFSKTFYRNIIKNWKNYIVSPGVKLLEHYFPGVPAIIVSAGPSLDKNIQLLKSIGENVIIIAVATALKPLLKSGIEPDFIVTIDADESTDKCFQFISPPKNSWLVFDPCAPSSVVDRFPGRKIAVDSGVYLSQWIAKRREGKGFLGKTFSVAHTAFLFACHMGCDPVILIGQNLSFSGKRLHCADSFYDENRKDRISSVRTLEFLENERFQDFIPSLKWTHDIFGQQTHTTTALDLYRNHFRCEGSRSTAVFNATEGGLEIAGAQTVSLREVLYRYGLKIKSRKKNNLPQDFQKPEYCDDIYSSLAGQSLRFRQILDDLKRFKFQISGLSHGDGRGKRELVRQMEYFYRTLVAEPETLKLMQGYLYSDFIEWNRRSGEIALKEKECREDEIIEEKFQRDVKFLDVLEDAADFLAMAFNNMASEKKAPG